MVGTSRPGPQVVRRRSRALAVGVVIAAAVAGCTGGSGGSPTPGSPCFSPGGADRSPGTSGADAPASPFDGTYDAVFAGDATGVTDVTDELVAFLEAHSGRLVALAPAGVYRVTSVGITAHDLVLDFRGAQLVGSDPTVSGILRLASSSDVTLLGPTVVGTGFEWVDDLQNEHGIHVDGGSGISIRDPIIHDTHGDGIYIGYQSDKNEPASRVEIIRPQITRVARNGISPVAGEVTISGGRIEQTGLFGVDFEPNDDVGAASIRGAVLATDIRQAVSLEAASVHAEAPYAIAAAGKSQAIKPSIRVEAVTGDRLQMTIRDTAAAVVCDSVSDLATTVHVVRTTDVAFFGNQGLTLD